MNLGKKLKITERGLRQKKKAAEKTHEKMRREGIYARMADKMKRPVRCVGTGEVYPSVKECAEALGVHNSTLPQAIKDGYRCKGNHYEFVGANP